MNEECLRSSYRVERGSFSGSQIWRSKEDYEIQKRNQKLNQEKKDLVEFAWNVLLSELCNTHEINALILASLLTLGYVVVCSFMYVNKIIPEVICKLPTSSNGGNSTDYVYVKKIGCYKYHFC